MKIFDCESKRSLIILVSKFMESMKSKIHGAHGKASQLNLLAKMAFMEKYEGVSFNIITQVH